MSDTTNADEFDGIIQGQPQHVHVYDAGTSRCYCGDEATPEDMAYMQSLAESRTTPGGWGNTDAMLSSQAGMIADARAAGYDAANTPNLVIENPRARKVANTAIAVVGLVLACVTAADVSSPAFDLSAYTEPAWAVFGILNGAFGLAVINSNIPKGR